MKVLTIASVVAAIAAGAHAQEPPRFALMEISRVPAGRDFCGAVSLNSGATVVCKKQELVVVENGKPPRTIPIAEETITYIRGMRAWRGDSLYLFSERGPTGVIVDRNGAEGRRTSFAALDQKMAGRHFRPVFNNGSVLLIEREWGRDPMTFLSEEGELRDTAEFAILSAERVRTIGKWQYAGEFRVRVDRSPNVIAAPLVRRLLVSAGGNRFAIGYTDNSAIDIIGVDGRKTATVPRTNRREVLTPARRAAVLADFVNQAEASDRPYHQRLVDMLPVVRFWPELHGLAFDQTGRLWVGRMSSVGCEWDVYSTDLRLSQQVQAPCTLQVIDALGDFVVGSANNTVLTFKLSPAKARTGTQ